MARRELMIQQALVDDLLIASRDGKGKGYKGNRKSMRERLQDLQQRSLPKKDSEGNTITRSPSDVFTRGSETERTKVVPASETDTDIITDLPVPEIEDPNEPIGGWDISVDWRTLLKIMQFIPEVVGSGLGINTYRP